MDFKILNFTLMFVLINCADSSNFSGSAKKVLNADQISSQTIVHGAFTSSLSTSVQAGQVNLVSNDGKDVYSFGLEPFEYSSHYISPDGIVIDRIMAAENYSLLIGRERIAVRIGDETNLDPIDFFGTIKTSDFDSTSNRAVIYDDLGSFGLVQLDDAGTVTDTWMGGPVINDVGEFISGAMLPGGNILMALPDDSFILIDFSESISNDKWVFERISYEQFWKDYLVENGLESEFAVLPRVEWIGEVKGQTNIVMIKAQSNIFTFDLTTKKIVDLKSLKGSLGSESFFVPTAHVIVQNIAGSVDLLMVDSGGKINERKIKLPPFFETGSLKVSDTFLDEEKDELAVQFENQGKIFLKVRISDSLIVSYHKMPSGSRTAVTQDHLIVLFNSPLGKVQRWEQTKKKDVETLEGFLVGLK